MDTENKTSNGSSTRSGESSTAKPSNESSQTISGMMGSAKQAANQAKDKAGDILEQAKGQATSKADQQKQTLASGMQSVAHAFRSMGEDLRGKEAGPVANYAAEIGQAIGGQVEQIAKYLDKRDIGQIVRETEAYATRSPAMFLGGAFVVGLAASRFLKSSQGGQTPQANPSQAGSDHPQLALPPASTPPPVDMPETAGASRSANPQQTSTPAPNASADNGSVRL